MNFGELKTAVLADAHRTNLSAHVARFVRLCEGLIARRLRATEMDATATLDDTDRVDAETGIYTLPSGLIEVRRITLGDVELEPRGPNALRLRGAEQSASYYAVLGATRLEVRGIPAAESELVVDYLGRFAALSGDTDTNALLTSHEALYMHGSLHYLYRHTKNKAGADDELGMFDNVLDALNEEAARKQSAGAAPAYDFGGGGGY